MSSQATAAAPAAQPAADERIYKPSFASRLLARPELGAVSGAVILIVFFLLAADSRMFSISGLFNWLEVCAQLGIIAIGACLLMIGGEFDLSIGSMIGFSSAILAMLIVNGGLPSWLAILLAFSLAMGIGFVLGTIVVVSRLPSFIVSLAFLFLLRGLMLVSMRLFHGDTQVEGISHMRDEDFFAWLFGGDLFTVETVFVRGNRENIIEVGIPMSLAWLAVLALAATWILARTRAGNWIYASGGNANSARSVGVPVNAVKIALFMFTALCAAIFGAIQAFDGGSVDAARGNLKDLEAIAASVIGGALLTGGYGSVIGACLGALIYGMVNLGFQYTSIDGDWYRVFLGGILLMAVAFNTFIRRRITGGS
ncbi:MAG: ABC transporter permease [Alphaproteobacteria bacterium]